MFEKFGEFNSAAEINETAVNLRKEGDFESLKALAEENGLDPEEAEDYITGAADKLCYTALMAAMGKLDLEEKDLEIGGVLKDWTDCIRDMCVDVDGMAEAVRKKGKTLAGCMAALIRFSFENKVQVSDKIVDITKVTHNGKEEKMRKPLYLGIPSRTEARQIIQDYYMNWGKGNDCI